MSGSPQLLDFVKDSLNICILGPLGNGKSYLAKALSIQACLKYQKKVRFFTNLDLLILDDEVSTNLILKRATKHYTVVIQPRG